MAQDLPDDMPVPKVPIDVQIVAETADEFGVDRADLVELLEDIYEYLGDNAQEIHTRAITELGEAALLFEGVHFEALYVDPDEWTEIREQLTLPERRWKAAKTSHNKEGERIIDSLDRPEAVDELATNDVLIMPTPIVAALKEAGLSQRQAAIQAMRMAGDSQKRISQKMGIATGTVKSHCDRIDRKIEQAERLLEVIENGST